MKWSQNKIGSWAPRKWISRPTSSGLPLTRMPRRSLGFNRYFSSSLEVEFTRFGLSSETSWSQMSASRRTIAGSPASCFLFPYPFKLFSMRSVRVTQTQAVRRRGFLAITPLPSGYELLLWRMCDNVDRFAQNLLQAISYFIWSERFAEDPGRPAI